MRGRKVVLGIALCAAAGAGCFRGGAGGPETGEAALRVMVTNDSWSDMTVYVRRGASRARLGMVTSQSHASFRVPAALAGASGDTFLEADPIGSKQLYRTEPILVRPGRTVTWTITNQPGLSSILVR